MFTVGQRLVVKDNHKFWPGVAGTFEFMGGSDHNVVVICVENPLLKERAYATKKLIAVAVSDVCRPAG